jgi:hypothetical protein
MPPRSPTALPSETVTVDLHCVTKLAVSRQGRRHGSEPFLFVRPDTNLAANSYLQRFWARRLDHGIGPRGAMERVIGQQQCLFAGTSKETGATGLEPATSGVTGHFAAHHVWRRSTCNRSSHAAFRGSARSDSAWLSEANSRRLLPVCCPAETEAELLTASRGRRRATRKRPGLESDLGQQAVDYG